MESTTIPTLNATQSQATSLHNSNTLQSDAIWGHILNPKEPNTIRIILQNMQGIDHKSGVSTKLSALHSFMQEMQVAIAALTECNAAWLEIDHSLYPTKQTKLWWENAHFVPHSQLTRSAHPYQPGGCQHSNHKPVILQSTTSGWWYSGAMLVVLGMSSR